jgi:thioredoxin:protein disulfide reductase
MKIRLATLLAFLGTLLYTPVLPAEPVVSIRAIPPTEPWSSGKPANLALELTIVPPYHINSDRPLEGYLIPTALEFDSPSAAKVRKVIFPPATVKKLPVSDTPMAVFDGTVRIAIEIAAEQNASDFELRGKLRYQACDDRACLPPVNQPFTVSIPGHSIDQSSSRPVGAANEAFRAGQANADYAAGRAAPGREAAGPVNFEGKGLAPILLLVFLGGFALNLTPCVYPMIPITITYFGGQAQGRKGSLLLHSFLYTIGMALTYSVLGALAALTGSLFGSAMQYPAVLMGIAAVMVLLALSMFDVYELRLPGFLTRLSGSSQRGFAGTFLMGLTVGIVAAPCIGPFVIGLLTYVGNKGSAVLGFILFFVLALGLGIPFLILGIFSGSIHRLPRSGAWMVWVRRAFGFVLIAMAVHFLKTLFPAPLLYELTLAMVILLAGIYLAWIDSAATAGKGFLYVRNLVGVVLFGLSIYWAFTGIQDHVGRAILNGPSTSFHKANSIEWLPYSEEALRQASLQIKPVFIDFYADWCAPCKELDTHTFAAPEVVSLSREFLMLKVDLTSTENPPTQALRGKYRIKGVPTLAFLLPDGQEITGLRGTGFEPRDVFLAKMKQALQKAGAQRNSTQSP